MEPFDFQAMGRSIRSAFQNLCDKKVPFMRQDENELPVFSTTKGGPPVVLVMKTKATQVAPIQRKNPKEAQKEIHLRLLSLEKNGRLMEELFPGFFLKRPYFQFKIMNALHEAVEDACSCPERDVDEGIINLSILTSLSYAELELKVLDFVEKMASRPVREDRPDDQDLERVLIKKSAKKKMKKFAARQKKKARQSKGKAQVGQNSNNQSAAKKDDVGGENEENALPKEQDEPQAGPSHINYPHYTPG